VDPKNHSVRNISTILLS